MKKLAELKLGTHFMYGGVEWVKFEDIGAAKGTTPLDGEDAVGMLIEEIADVQNCIAVLSERLPGLQDKANKISAEKMKRWKERLR